MTKPKPFHSIYAGNPDMQQALELYVIQLRDLADHLEDASREQDIEQLRSLCGKIKCDGHSHGFERLADLAGTALDAFKAQQPDVDSLQSTVHDIIDVARHVKAQ